MKKGILVALFCGVCTPMYGGEVPEWNWAERYAVPIGASPVLGGNNALVTIVEFSDFNCGWCARAHPVIQAILENYPDQVRWVFKSNPRGKSDSREAFWAAMAAGEQGAFWTYHDRLFEDKGIRGREAYLALAGELLLDVNAFSRALEGEKVKGHSAVDESLGRCLSATGTPHFFINGKRFVGYRNEEEMTEIIERELALAQGLEVEDTYGAVMDLSTQGEGCGQVEFTLAGGTEAVFSLEEILRGQRKVVVGTNDEVMGTITVDFAHPKKTTISAIEIDARAFLTDADKRNKAIQERILHTDQYPTIRFTPTHIGGLPVQFVVGEEITFTITGDLWIGSISRPEIFFVRAIWGSPQVINGIAETTVLWRDYALRIPNIPILAGVDEEVQLTLRFVATATL